MRANADESLLNLAAKAHGNPFLVKELVGGLRRGCSDHRRRAACGAWRLSGPRNPAPCQPTQSAHQPLRRTCRHCSGGGIPRRAEEAAPGRGIQRPFLIDSLLEGRAFDRWSLWEVASRLRLPANGPFVVIAAEVPAVGSEALPEIESKLRSRDVYSAWRLQPDLQVGIVHVKSERQLDEILGLVSSVGDGSSRRQCALRRSARHAASSAFRQGDAAGPDHTRPRPLRCSTARFWPPRQSAPPM